MSHVECDVLLYAGEWSPRRRGTLQNCVRHALCRMCCYYGDAYIHSVLFVPLPAAGDGPCVAVRIVADWWREDPGLFADFVYEALVYHLAPRYESQLEIERSEEMAARYDYRAYRDVARDGCCV